jgi:HTH-type transcriptional regulator / antitoxin HigA
VNVSTAFPIRTAEDLERAIALVDELWGAEPGSAEADLLEVMSTLIDRFEAERSDLPPADPIELVRFKLTELGWSQRELGRRLAWSAGRVSEVLNRKRPLTLGMVRSLSRVLDIPTHLLVHDHRDEEGNGWVAVSHDVGRRVTAAAARDQVSVERFVSSAIEASLAGTSANVLQVTIATVGSSTSPRGAPPVVAQRKAA